MGRIISDLSGTAQSSYSIGRVTFNGGVVTAPRELVLPDHGGRVLASPVMHRTTITAENYSIESMREVAAVAIENVWAPDYDANSVVPTAFFSNVADTTDGDMVGLSHQISVFNYHVTRGGGSQAIQYGEEFRVRQEDGSHLGAYIAVKHVIEPTSSNSGTQGSYVLEQFDDMRGNVTHVGLFSREFLDPRILTIHAGGEIRLPEVITANRTMTDLDSGKTFWVVSATDITVTVPNTLTDGFRATFIQALAGRAVLSLGSMTVVEPDGLTATQGIGYSAVIYAVPSSSIVYLNLTKPPVAVSAGLKTTRVYGSMGRSTLMSPQAVAVSANTLYVVPIFVPRRTTIGTLGCRVATSLAANNLRLALFASNKAGLPGVRLYQSANISTATAGNKQVTGIGVTVDPGVYFVGIVASGGVTIQWALSIALEEVFGRSTVDGMETLPVYSATLTTIPTDLSAVTPTYIDPSVYAPDIYWQIS